MIESIKNYVQENAVPLFACDQQHPLKSLFNENGFALSEKAALAYVSIKNLPHLYVAFSDQQEGYHYVGQSSQKGGRWRNQHAYHLGTLAHHLLGTTNKYDQNHQHWIDSWMRLETAQLEQAPYSIELKAQTYIAFIPFNVYSTAVLPSLSKGQIKQTNNQIEKQLIDSYRQAGYHLLNKHHNTRAL